LKRKVTSILIFDLDLPIPQLAEQHRRDPVVLAHPHEVLALNPTVPVRNMDRIATSAGIEQTQLAVAASSLGTFWQH
jgi:hypothetical protein